MGLWGTIKKFVSAFSQNPEAFKEIVEGWKGLHGVVNDQNKELKIENKLLREQIFDQAILQKRLIDVETREKICQEDQADLRSQFEALYAEFNLYKRRYE